MGFSKNAIVEIYPNEIGYISANNKKVLKVMLERFQSSQHETGFGVFPLLKVQVLFFISYHLI